LALILSEVLKRSGYITAAFHSNPYLSDYFGWNRGWDQFYDSMQDSVTDITPYILGDVINEKVKSWLNSYKEKYDDKPFFLWTHYMDVHEPYVPDKKYVDVVDPGIDMTKDEMFALFKEVLLPRKVDNPEKVEILKKLYYAHVREVDDYVKEFFEILEDSNVLENSIVIITSDHGDEFNDHGGLSHDGKMYSELINVPLIIYDPNLKECKLCDTVVSGADIPPTIAYLFGIDSPSEWHGQPLLPLDQYQSKGSFGVAMGKIGHKAKETDRPVYFYQEDNLRISYRVENNHWEMYDLEEDPKEKNNIFDDSAAAKEMKEKLLSNIQKITPEVYAEINN